MLDNSILNDINSINEVNSIHVDNLANATINFNNINVFHMNICSINANIDKLILMLTSFVVSFT